VERLLETVERFEEDLTDRVRVYRPLRVVVRVGEPLEVGGGRDRGRSEDPLMEALTGRLEALLKELAAESTGWPGPEATSPAPE
jgi:hypothetical protein